MIVIGGFFFVFRFYYLSSIILFQPFCDAFVENNMGEEFIVEKRHTTSHNTLNVK